MYVNSTPEDQFINGLKGWEFDRNRHGSLYDRGSADSYYGRAPDPHYGGVGGGSGDKVVVTDPASRAEYFAGYEQNEREGNKKAY